MIPRWRQRLQSLNKAFDFFEKACLQGVLSDLEIAGLVQSFEFTFELAWKTMKDYLYKQGIDTKFPRETIKEAFRQGMINDGHLWIEMLDKLNELSHTYNEQESIKTHSKIKSAYYPAIKELVVLLAGK